jgi:hypothetical protein
MDLLELINQKAFLGQEFLTWLWYVSEEEEPPTLADGRSVQVSLGDRLVLGPAQGAEGTRVTVKGQEVSLAEARQALRRGKLVEAMRLGLEMEGEEYWLNLTAAELAISSLKLPPVAPAEDILRPEPQGGIEPEPEGPSPADGLVLERVALIGNTLDAVEGLYKVFLARRLDEDKAAEMKQALRAWAEQG